MTCVTHQPNEYTPCVQPDLDLIMDRTVQKENVPWRIRIQTI